MNGVKNETHVRVEQTARGIWYCSGVDVFGENIAVLREEMELTLNLVEQVLAQHNKVQPTDAPHADLSTSQSAPKTKTKVPL